MYFYVNTLVTSSRVEISPLRSKWTKGGRKEQTLVTSSGVEKSHGCGDFSAAVEMTVVRSK